MMNSNFKQTVDCLLFVFRVFVPFVDFVLCCLLSLDNDNDVDVDMYFVVGLYVVFYLFI